MTKWHNFCTSCYECSNALQHFLLTKVVGKQFFHKIFFQQILCVKLLLVLAKRLEAIRWALILAKSIEAVAMIVESDSKDYVYVWIQIISSCVCVFWLLFLVPAALFDQVNREQCTHALFMDPQIPLFSNFFIKNGSHSTIYTFKNYFATVFSVLVFNFSKNKLNPNRPYVNALAPFGKKDPWRIRGICSEILNLISLIPGCHVTWIPREVNKAAHSLAKWFFF